MRVHICEEKGVERRYTLYNIMLMPISDIIENKYKSWRVHFSIYFEIFPSYIYKNFLSVCISLFVISDPFINFCI